MNHQDGIIQKAIANSKFGVLFCSKNTELFTLVEYVLQLYIPLLVYLIILYNCYQSFLINNFKKKIQKLLVSVVAVYFPLVSARVG